MKAYVSWAFTLIVALIMTACAPAQAPATVTSLPTSTETAAPPTATQTATPTHTLPTAPSATVTHTPRPTAMPTPPLIAAWKFVFTSQGKLWIKDMEAEAQVVADMGNITSAKISPDGSQIIFIRTNPSPDMELWSVNSDGSGLNRLAGEGTLAGVGVISTGSFSPDGKFVVFVFKPGEGSETTELWTAKMDGSGAKKLVGIENLTSDFNLVDESGVYILPMTWIQNTNRLLFYPYKMYDGPVYDPLMWVDVETGRFGEFLPEGAGGLVNFSPDSSKYTVANTSSVSLFDLNSQEIISKITFPDLKYRGSWLPDIQWAQDSSRFLVALPPSSADQSQDYTVPAPSTIWSVGVDGSDPVEITTITAQLYSIAFSPDLELIAYNTGGAIGIINQSGSIHKKLSPQAAGFGMPEVAFEQWSPDSRRFTYLAGDNMCACGYNIIADVSSNERLKLHDKPYMSGYVAGFITWLDSNTYLFYDYPSSESLSAVLVLSELNGEDLSWPGEPEQYVVDYWTP
jgi:hypothetical protein